MTVFNVLEEDIFLHLNTDTTLIQQFFHNFGLFASNWVMFAPCPDELIYSPLAQYET
jgi:hypothetical protein